MSGTVRVQHGDVNIRLIECKVVIASIPEDDIRFFFSLTQNRLVVDTGIDDDTIFDVGFILLPLLNGSVLEIEIGECSKPLHPLFNEISIRHGMSDCDHLLSTTDEDVRHTPGCLAFAASRPDGTD